MAVLKGEGRVPILFGSLALPTPPNRSAYIARPDLAGEFATVVVAVDEAGVTPGIKALARHLARFGYAVLVPVLRPELDRAAHDLAAAVDSARVPGTPWASADRMAIVGIGAGGTTASIVAADEEVDALVLIDASIDPDLLEQHSGSLLVLHGGADEAMPAGDLEEMRRDQGRGEWILYRGVGRGFFDDAAPDHDPGAAADVRDRLVSFLDARFGVVAPA